MPYKKRYTRIAFNEELCRALEERRRVVGHYGSLTSYIVTVLWGVLKGTQTEPKEEAGTLVTAAKVDSKQKAIQAYERSKTG